MRYYAIYDNSELLSIGIGSNSGAEITKEEYERLLAEIQTKAQLVSDVYNGTKSIDDVPAKWQVEISKRVSEQKEQEKMSESPEREISDEEAQQIIMEGI